MKGRRGEITRALEDRRRYKLQYLEGGEWKTWVPDPAPWEKKPFGEIIPKIVVEEGILVLESRFPLRVIDCPIVVAMKPGPADDGPLR